MSCRCRNQSRPVLSEVNLDKGPSEAHLRVMPETAFIYALCEPGTRTIRYIGKTLDLSSRLKSHWRYSRKKPTALGAWLTSLSSPPAMIRLHTLLPSETWQEEETRYIRSARILGINLVNGNDGGCGGANPTSETREKISRANSGRGNGMFGRPGSRRGQTTPAHVRAKQSLAKRGARHPNFGKHLSETTRARISAARVGYKLSASAREKIGAAHRGKKNAPRTAAHCLALSQALSGRKLSPEHRAALSAAKLR